MSEDYCKSVVLDGVEVQENGIIRDKRGWIIGRADNEWMRYQWRMLESGICPCCGRDVNVDKPRTLEDVLREFTDEVIEWSGYSGPVSGDRTWSGMAAKYADEIREIMGEEC